MRLQGKMALITGGSSGIRLAMAIPSSPKDSSDPAEVRRLRVRNYKERMERPHQLVRNRPVTKGELIAVLFKEILMSHHFDIKLAREDPSLNLCDFYLFDGPSGKS